MTIFRNLDLSKILAIFYPKCISDDLLFKDNPKKFPIFKPNS